MIARRRELRRAYFPMPELLRTTSFRAWAQQRGGERTGYCDTP